MLYLIALITVIAALAVHLSIRERNMQRAMGGRNAIAYNREQHENTHTVAALDHLRHQALANAGTLNRLH